MIDLGRFSQAFFRRNPITGPILKFLYGATLTVQLTSMLILVLLCLTPASPLKGEFGSHFMLLGPHGILFLIAFWTAGSGIWRSGALLAGSAVLGLHGVLRFIWLTFLPSQPVSSASLSFFFWTQWFLLLGVILAAFLPGWILSLFLRRLSGR